eukprot:tig00000865_g5090.t1
MEAFSLTIPRPSVGAAGPLPAFAVAAAACHGPAARPRPCRTLEWSLPESSRRLASSAFVPDRSWLGAPAAERATWTRRPPHFVSCAASPPPQEADELEEVAASAPGPVLLKAAIVNLTAAGFSFIFVHDLLQQDYPLLLGPRDVFVSVVLGTAAALPFCLVVRGLLGPAGEELARRSPPLARFKANLDAFRYTSGGMRVGQAWALAALVAIGEESIFRAVVQSGIASLGAPLVGLAASSAVFGVLHGRDPVYVAFTGLGSLAFGAAYALAGYNLLAPLLAHALFDAWFFAFVATLPPPPPPPHRPE